MVIGELNKKMFALFSFRNDEHTYLAVVVVVVFGKDDDDDDDDDDTIAHNDDLNILNR